MDLDVTFQKSSAISEINNVTTQNFFVFIEEKFFCVEKCRQKLEDVVEYNLDFQKNKS